MKTDRLIAIIMILQERQKMSLKELAEICQVSPRTIQRDLDSINQAGVPIVSYPGVGGGVGIMESYKLDKRLFTTDDFTALLLGLKQLPPALADRAVTLALAKVEGLVPAAHQEAVAQKVNRFAVDSTPWNQHRDFRPLLTTIQIAMAEKRLLHFSYHNSGMAQSIRQVEPYCLIQKEMSWYLEGYCRLRADFRLFKLARMSQVTLLSESFPPRAYTPSNQRQSPYEDNDIPLATLRLTAGALDRFAELVDLSRLKKVDETSWLLRLPIPQDENGYKFLLSLGLDAQCLEPPALLAGFSQYLDQLHHRYRPAR